MPEQPKTCRAWCWCGHDATDHNGNYNGSEACDHCPCRRYKRADASQRSGRWDEAPEVWVDHDREPLKHKPEQCPRCDRDMTLRHHCGTPIDADELIRRLEQSALLAFKAADSIDPDDGLHYRGKGCGIQWAIAVTRELANGGEA